MLLAEARHDQRSGSEAKRGTRFARGVVWIGIASFTALTALVARNKVADIDRAIASRYRRTTTRGWSGRW